MTWTGPTYRPAKTTWWQDSAHPVWSLLRLTVQFAGASCMLWLTASSFDATELQALGGIVGIGALAERFIRPGGK